MDRISTIFSVVLAVILASYIGAYLLLVDPEPPMVTFGVSPWARRAHYSAGGKFAETLFWPLQKADKYLRPRHWEYHDGDEY